MNTVHSASRPAATVRPHAPRHDRDGASVAVLAHEHHGDYQPGDPDDGEGRARDDGPRDDGPRDDDGARDAGEVGPGLRDRITELARLAGEVLALSADDESAVTGGELGGLLELLTVVDQVNAAAVELCGRARRHGRAERTWGLPLEQVLAMRSKATFPDRRTLATVAETLPFLPNVRAAFHAGVLGWAQVRTIVFETRTLAAGQRARLDAAFTDLDRLSRLDADVLVDEVRAAVEQLRPDLAADREVRKVERRYLHLQPDLDGGVAGQFELAGEAGSILLTALDAASPPPSAGPRDHTRHAVGHAHPDQDQTETPDGMPAFTDTLVSRTLARRRADGLVTLAETYLAGTPTTAAAGSSDGGSTNDGETAAGPPAGDTSLPASSSPAGTARRAVASMTVIADIGQLTGNDPAAQAARTLLATYGGRLRLTPTVARRIAENARLRFLLVDHGAVLGISRPTTFIPAAVRAAVEARDQGCRFAGCRAPIHWCDLHHIVFRSDEGPTEVDNLVALCRRHHTAVHQGGWKLTMAPTGVVTLKRGRYRHTTDPPLRRPLLADP